MMLNHFYWIWHIVLAVVALFFLLFGIQLLVIAYRFNDPFYFIMTFFSSNLIILISGALLFGLIWRMAASRKATSEEDKHP